MAHKSKMLVGKNQNQSGKNEKKKHKKRRCGREATTCMKRKRKITSRNP
jgi:hypothetical protein